MSVVPCRDVLIYFNRKIKYYCKTHHCILVFKKIIVNDFDTLRWNRSRINVHGIAFYVSRRCKGTYTKYINKVILFSILDEINFVASPFVGLNKWRIHTFGVLGTYINTSHPALIRHTLRYFHLYVHLLHSFSSLSFSSLK